MIKVRDMIVFEHVQPPIPRFTAHLLPHVLLLWVESLGRLFTAKKGALQLKRTSAKHLNASFR